ncbi:rRNA maturation RNase YbeY [candidate division TM6 bacterium RIFCSPHIGHO2_12_FULL_32_22]|nr:MAG: rRNA maturation RNase YbeY [candidate division TM6 bacterium RIFCSPHIGHO2_12_FULL_32_22]
MIAIKNRQRKYKINLKELESNALKILTFLGYKDFDLGILITTNATIRKYNREYRNKDKATDIISFPFHYNLKPGEKIKAKSKEEKNIGDIIISPEFIDNDAKKAGITFKSRLNHILVHGICHLLGYDHYTEASDKLMKAQEDKLIKLL